MNIVQTLFKKTNTGALQQWAIWVVGATIHTEFGQVGGKLQHTQDLILKGKNPGKANATTPEQQAEAEARAKYQKQLKKGYCVTKEDAMSGATDDIIEGGIWPMLSLSKSHPKDPILAKYLKYPCMIQSKLDGACCIAIIEDGKATLWSRTRKPINSCPHIIEDLERRFPTKGKIILHGELYNHEYWDRFEDLLSIIRKDEPDEEGLYKDIQLHVYDCPGEDRPGYKGIPVTFVTPYQTRYSTYVSLLGPVCSTDIIQAVHGVICNNEEELLAEYEKLLLLNYEGGMAKNLQAPYDSGKRSSNILKMKEFQEGEALIVDMEVGRGKEHDVAAKFVFNASIVDGMLVPPQAGYPVFEFRCRMKCPFKEKRRHLKDKDKIVGKVATIRFKRFTNKGSLHIPVGQTFRDYE